MIEILFSILFIISVLLFPFTKLKNKFFIPMLFYTLSHIYVGALFLFIHFTFYFIFFKSYKLMKVPKIYFISISLITFFIFCSLINNPFNFRVGFQILELYLLITCTILILFLIKNNHQKIQLFLKYQIFSSLPLITLLNLNPKSLPANETIFVLIFFSVIPCLTLYKFSSIKFKLFIIFNFLINLHTAGIAGSRSGFLIIIFLFCLYIATNYKIKKYKIIYNSIIMITITCAIFLLPHLTLTYGNLDSNLSQMSLFDLNNYSNLERFIMLFASYELFLEKPLLGWGWGSIDSLFNSISYLKLNHPHPHNSFAHILVELGIFGFISFIIYKSLFFVFFLKTKNSPFKLYGLYCFISLMLTSMIDVIFFGVSRGLPISICLGLVMCIYMCEHNQNVRNSRPL